MAVKLEIEGFKSLNEQLGEAEDRVRNLVNQFGVGSKEVQQAAQEAGKFKQQMIEADRAIESFTASGRFDAVAGGIQGVVGGFAAVQGAMAVVGVESEDLQQTLVKVQGALALVEGVKGVTEFAKSFSTLKTVAVSAFNGIKAAIGSTGIGLLIVGLGLAIGALIEYFDELNETELKNKGITEDLDKSVIDLRDSYDKLSKSIQDSSDIAIAQGELDGKSEKELFEIKKKAVNDRIALNQKALLDEYRLSVERKGNARRTITDEKKLDEELKKISDDYLARLKTLGNEETALDKELTLLEINFQKGVKDRNTKAKQDRDKNLADKKKSELDSAKALREALRKLAEERENDEIKNAQLTFENDLVRLKEANDEELKQENLTDEAKRNIEAKYQADILTRTQKFNEQIEKLNADKLKKLEDDQKKYADNIKRLTDEEFADTTKSLENYFAGRQKSLLESNLNERDLKREQDQLDLEALEAKLVANKDYAQDVIQIERDIAAKKREIRLSDEQEEKDKLDRILDFTFQSLNSIADTQEMFLNTRMNNERAELVNLHKFELESASTSAEDRADLEYSLASQMEVLNQEQFENDKQMSIARATISGIEAAVNAYKAGVIFGPQVGALFAAISLAFTGAQIAAISQQQYVPSIIKEPETAATGRGSRYEEGGLLLGPSHDMGGVRTTLGELEGGEFIMNRRSTASFLPLLEQLNNIGNDAGPQLAQAQGTPVVKAYVVASEMTSQQEANARIGRLARL